MSERTRNNFIKLANNRVNKTIKAIRLIGNLSNRVNYEYTGEDVAKILSALEAELEACRQRFEQPGASEEQLFQL